MLLQHWCDSPRLLGGARYTSNLFAGNPHFLDHAPIFGELFTSQDAEFLGRAAAHGETQFFQLAAHLGIADRLQNLGIEPRDDILWRAGRRKNGKPRIEVEAGQA